MSDVSNREVTIVVSKRVRPLIGQVLIGSIALLVLLGTLGEVARLGFGFNTVLGLIRLFGLGQEANVPTWFSSASFLIAALLAAVIALVKRQCRDALATQWFCLSLLLCFMSLDETAMMHETFSVVAAQVLLGVKDQPWFIYYAWILPGIIVAGAIVWCFSTLWRSLDTKTRSGFTWAAVVYFGGVLGMEVVEAAFAAVLGLQQADASPYYTAVWTTQELMEMAGVAILILTMVDYLALSQITITMHASPAAKSVGSES